MKYILKFLVINLAFLSFLATNNGALASELVVNDPNSAVNENGLCSLSEAIININNQNSSGSEDCASGLGVNTIYLSTDVSITEPFLNGGNNFVGTPFITKSLTIDGNGNSVSRSSEDFFDLFRSDSPINLTFQNIIFSGGQDEENLGGILFLTGVSNVNIFDSEFRNSRYSIYAFNNTNSGKNLNIVRTRFSGNKENILNAYKYRIRIIDSYFENNSGVINSWPFLSSSSLINLSSSEMLMGRTTFDGNIDAVMLATNGGWGEGVLSKIIIDDSTFSNNFNESWHSVLRSQSSIDLKITNSTFSNNVSLRDTLSFQNFDDLSKAVIAYSTFVNNDSIESEAYPDGATIRMDQVSEMINFSVENSLFYENTEDCDFSFAAQSVSLIGNLSDSSCGTTQATGIDTNLANNGGPTRTHKLLQGSNAIDTAVTTGVTVKCPKHDQRGYIRGTDGNGDGVSGCDVGAYEVYKRIVPGTISSSLR
jgi:hypothetical protein